jgi:hypothetical protein
MVQTENGTEFIPEEKPKCSIFLTAGSGAKPWQTKKSWIPEVQDYKKTDDIAIVTSFFGDDTCRIAAARKGLEKIDSLDCPKVLVEMVDEAGKTKFPEWNGQRVELVLSDENRDIWQKENLWNIGGEYILRNCPDIGKIIWVDADVSPTDDWSNNWIFFASQALDKYKVVQPWMSVKESTENQKFLSYSWTTAAGAKIVSHGQGFCIAMTAQWFWDNRFPDQCLSGSGDVLTILCQSSPMNHTKQYLWNFRHWRDLVESYDGDKTGFGWLPCTLIHNTHGKRGITGDGYRPYHHRNYLLSFVDGHENIVEKDERGLWKWKDSHLARAARLFIQKERNLKSDEEMLDLWDACLRKAKI